MKLRVSKALHARMRSRADAIGVDLSELVRRCVVRWQRTNPVDKPVNPTESTYGGTVLNLYHAPLAPYLKRDLRGVIWWALDQTETQAEPLELESVDVEYV